MYGGFLLSTWCSATSVPLIISELTGKNMIPRVRVNASMRIAHTPMPARFQKIALSSASAVLFLMFDTLYVGEKL